MTPWWVAVVALVIGFDFGVVIMACVAAGKGGRE